MSCCEVPGPKAQPQIQSEVTDGQSGANRCPSCGHTGRKVSRITIKALLKAEPLKRLDSGGYRFCASPDCRTVYFAGDSMFALEDVRVPVWQKSGDPAVFVCYCFEHSEDTIRAGMEQGDEAMPLEEIRRLVQEGRCACEVRNPQGTCCLGNVAQVVKSLMSDSRR